MKTPNRLTELLTRLERRVERAPDWLRPGLVGAAFVYMFVIMRGGLIVLPILFVVLAFKDPRALLFWATMILVAAPTTGFLGGLAYGIAGTFTKGLGRTGKVFQFVVGVWVYCVILVFFLAPRLDSTTTDAFSTAENWMVATGMGIVFGLALGLSATGKS